jgi:hypothetical protein
MRMEREGLSAKEAVDAVLRENIHGLEIDRRCVELAAFALAFAAWCYPDLPSPSGRGAGGEGARSLGYCPLPDLNLACSGLSVGTTRKEWEKLANGDSKLRTALFGLYEEFKNAPLLGSLIDPMRSAAAKLVQWDGLAEAVGKALDKDRDYQQQEAGVAALGLAEAARILARRYHLVITNVPYLARGKQDEKLRAFCEEHYPEAKNDLATVFLDRCLELASPPSPSGRGAGGEGALGGTVSVVLPQNWLFLTSYKKFREKLLKNDTWHLIARLGPGAFENISGEVVKAVLISLSRGNSLTPAFSQRERGQQTLLPLGEGARRADERGNLIRGVDVSEPRTATEKAARLLTTEIKSIEQAKQLENQDARVAFDEVQGDLLEDYAISYKGITTGDDTKFRRKFWDLVEILREFRHFQSTVDDVKNFAGCESVVWYESMTNPIQPGVYLVPERKG